jgi:hypothetical protein
MEDPLTDQFRFCEIKSFILYQKDRDIYSHKKIEEVCYHMLFMANCFLYQTIFLITTFLGFVMIELIDL